MVIQLSNLLIVLCVIFLTPIIGGLLSGIDRKLTARMQNRVGPPLLQPFYDVLKLFGKEEIYVNQYQMIYVIAHLFFAIISLILFALGQDLLVIIFTLAFSTVAIILGAMSVRSPYSKVGAQREIMQMLAYEPVLLFTVIGVYMVTNSFMVKSIFMIERPLLYSLPLVFFALIYVLTIKLRKSPFDFSSSHHGHQEIIKGITTEFAGPQLALIEIAHWFETVFILALIAVFFANPIWIGVLIALVAFLLELVVDNICARLTWRWMLKATWAIGIVSGFLNIVWLYYMKG